MMILSASLLTSCATSKNYGSNNNIPPFPTSVENNGWVTKLPKDAKALGPAEAQALLAKVRENELRQARAVRAAKNWRTQLVKGSGGK